MGACGSKNNTRAPSRVHLHANPIASAKTSHAAKPKKKNGGWTGRPKRTGKPGNAKPIKKAYKTNRRSPPPRSSNYDEIDLDYLEEETIDIWDATYDAAGPAGAAGEKPREVIKIQNWRKVDDHINDDMSSEEEK